MAASLVLEVVQWECRLQVRARRAFSRSQRVALEWEKKQLRVQCRLRGRSRRHFDEQATSVFGEETRDAAARECSEES